MDKNERSKNESEFVEKCCDTSCCGNWGDFKIPKVDRVGRRPGGCCSMMGECRWFALIPVALGVVLLLLGYYLDAEITRVLWMAVAGLTVLLGTFGLIMMSRIKGACCQ
jgi:hypothetical protein